MVSRYFTTVAVFAALAVSPAIPALACAPWQTGGEMAGTVKHRRITESSGLAASRRQDGLFWTHNDSGGAARLYALDSNGDHIAAANFEKTSAEDWEDMAAGPCTPDGEKTCLYIADVGDNGADRQTVHILRTPEPDMPDETPATVTLEPPTVYAYEYPEGPRNAETLMVHPETAELYVVEKTTDKEASIYRVPRDQADGDDKPAVAEPVGALSVNRGLGGHVTGGDISPNGEEFSVRTYIKVFTFCADADAEFETAFEAEPVESHPRFTIQSESLAYGADGKSLWFTSEGRRAPLVKMPRQDD